MLEERHSSELGQPVWAAGERSENGFLVGARQPDDRPSMPPGRLERFRGAVESERPQTSNEIAHEPVGDRKTCEQHSVERTRGDYRPRPPGCKPVERSELAAQSCRVRPAGPRLLRGETRVDERKHVVRIRIPADHRLRKHERVVHVNVKDAVAAGDDLDRRKITLVLLKQSRRQTDGVREGASRNAVLDADAECVRHCLDSCIRKRLCAAVERLATLATPELSARRATSVLSAPARLLFRRRRLGRPVWDALGDARRQDVHLTRPSCIR